MILRARWACPLLLCGTTITACSLATSFDALTSTATGDASLADARADGASPAADASADSTVVGVDGSIDYRAVILADTPLGYFRLDDPPGSGMAHDETGAHDANVVGGVTFGVKGVAGTAATFTDGTYLDLGQIYDFPHDAPWSIEAWTRPALTTTFENIVVKRQNNGDGMVLYVRTDEDSGPQAQLEIAWPNGARGGWAPFPAGGFVHVAVTYSTANGLHLYVNNVAAASVYDQDTDGGPTTNPAGFLWGAGMVGALDELAVYDHELPRARVQAHYLAGHGP